jgi:hypothetical protein
MLVWLVCAKADRMDLTFVCVISMYDLLFMDVRSKFKLLVFVGSVSSKHLCRVFAERSHFMTLAVALRTQTAPLSA